MSFSVIGQLTSVAFAGGVTGSIQYNYSATQNNGQITQAVDTISGETISYQYDALKRLISASSTPNTGSSVAAWNQTYQFDGFGNLTQKTVNGMAYSLAVNAATNQLSSAVYDANGNTMSGAWATMVYDVANRMVSAQTSAGGIEYYGYAPDNKQVYRRLPSGSAGSNEEFTFYGAMEEKLGVFAPSNPTTFTLMPIRSNVYFAGKMIWSDGAPVYQDRLATNRANGARFYPYGDEIGGPNATSNDREKFATYTRDGYTGLDISPNRAYASTYGRFNTADPYKASAGPSDPGSWNRYSYTRGDPINLFDPSGLDDCNAEGNDGDTCFEPSGSIYGLWDGVNIGSGSAAGWGITGTLYGVATGTVLAFLNSSAAPAPPSLPAALPPPQCSISLDERPVGGIAGAVGADHTYLYLQGPASLLPSQGSETVEGGPDFSAGAPIFYGYLMGFVSNPPGGPTALAGTLPGGSGNKQVGQAYTGANACGDIATIAAAVSKYDNSGNWAIYNPTPALGPGYNSNSFTFTLLQDAGLSTSFGSTGFTPGWGYTVPGLK
jgi:RHS repeat-associated protein